MTRRSGGEIRVVDQGGKGMSGCLVLYCHTKSQLDFDKIKTTLKTCMENRIKCFFCHSLCKVEVDTEVET